MARTPDTHSLKPSGSFAGKFLLIGIRVVVCFAILAIAGPVFAQEKANVRPKVHDKIVPRGKANGRTDGFREPEIDLGKIYVTPPQSVGSPLSVSPQTARQDLQHLSRQSEFIRRSLKRLEKRAATRRQRRKKQVRRPCV